MGCGSINKPNQSIWYNAFSGLFRYRVKVLLEDSSILDFIHEDQFDEMPVTAVMNIIAFNDKDSANFDANFISTYDKSNDQFDYFVQRLVGKEMNNDKEWVLMINKEKFTWNYICKQNIKVRPQDSIVWVLISVKENRN